MIPNGSLCSLNEMNEFQMQWNKGMKPCQNFETVCSHSCHVMISRVCSFDTFVHNTNVTWSPSTEADVAALVLLLEQGELWPSTLTSKRDFRANFWWDSVRPCKKVGSEKDKQQEGVTEETHVQSLFDVLCSYEGERDFDKFEVVNLDDDDIASVVSSTMGSVASCDNDSPVDDDIDNNADAYDNPDSDNLIETERETNNVSTLKKLGNIKKKKPVSPLMLKDMLGADEEAIGSLIAKNHMKLKKDDCRIINGIYRSVKYFDQLFEKRRKRLHENIKRSKKGSYVKQQYCYRNKFRSIVNEKRLRNICNY
jgi:hypothetical protein